MVNPYEYKPEIKWYHVLWDMRDKSFRDFYIKNKRRHLRMMWKYERHRFVEAGGLGLFAASALILFCGLDTINALLRWPTEDVNELLKSRVWQNYRNEVNERKEKASKLLEDSNYISNKNNPSE